MKAKLPWFRMYAEFVDDPKVQRLPGDLFKFWANCLGLACQNDGILPSVRDIAWKMKLKEAKVSASIATLYESGLLDQEVDTFSPHNWSVRQFKSDTSTERVNRFRNKKETFQVTPPSVSVSDSESPVELELKKEAPKIQRPPPVAMSERFLDFWERHPGKKLRQTLAAGVWAHTVTIQNEDACFACLDRYLASQEVANRAFMNPETWLSECVAGGFTATWPAAKAHQNGKQASQLSPAMQRLSDEVNKPCKT